MADNSPTTGGISILFPGAFWARRQLHSGIRYMSVQSKAMKLLSSVEGVSILPLAEFYSMEDSSTTTTRIPILFAEGCWTRSQLHKGIIFISVAWKPTNLTTCVKVIHGQNSTQLQITPQRLQGIHFCLLEVVGIVSSYVTVYGPSLSHANSGSHGQLWN